MKTRYVVALSMLAGAALGAVSVGGLYAQGNTPGAYVVIDFSEMLDADAFTMAVAHAEPQATTSAGGRFIIRSTEPIAIDGPAPVRFVVIAFDTEEKAKAWSLYPGVSDVNAVRMTATKSRAFVVAGAPQ